MNLEKTEYTNIGMTTKERQVYNQIKEAILKNEFKPGTVLVERRLSEIYNVSRSPVRYALRQLAKEGLLTDEPGKGIIVPVYTLEDILEVYDLLEVLQVYAIQVSLKNYDLITDATLGQIIEQQRKASEHDDMLKRSEWDVKFHEFIIHHVSNKRLDMIFELLVNQKRRFDLTSFNDIEHGQKSDEQHEKIYQAILERDVDKSVDAIREHLQYIKQYYINKLVTGRYNL